MSLLDRALKIHNAQEWARMLNLSKNALYEARSVGHLTPVVAGGIAMELDENPERWITLAVLEGEKDSPAKRLLTKKLQKVSEL